MTAAAADNIGSAEFLRLAATATAIAALAGGDTSFSTVAAMALSIFLYAAAERHDEPRLLAPPRALPAAGARPRWPAAAWISLALAVALCGASAAAVASEGTATAQHLSWAAGLVLFGVTAAIVTTPPELGWRKVDFAAAFLIVVVCTLSTVWQIEVLPPEIHGDESEVGLDARRLLFDPERRIFASGWFGLPALHAGTKALGFVAFGNDLWGLRMGSAALATATALLLFSVVRRLSGTPLALAAALLLATQRYFMHIGRTGFHYIDTPFFSVLALWLFIRLWQDRRPGAAIWCGVVLGLAMHTYFASRFIPVLVSLTALLLVARAPRGERWRRLGEVVLIGVVALAVAAPLGAYFASHLDEFFGRVEETSILQHAAREHLSQAYGTNSLRDLFLLQLRLVMAMFHFVGDTAVQYGYGAPLLDEISGVLLLAGCGSMLARPASPLTVIALLWTLLPMVAGGALTIDTPFFPRMSGILPFVAVIVATGAVRLVETTIAVFAAGGRREARRAVVMAVLLATVAGVNATTYVFDYAVHHQHTQLRDVAAWLRGGGGNATNFLLDDDHRLSLYHGTVSFLAGSTARQDVRDVETFLQHPPLDANRSRFIAPRGGEGALARLQEEIGPLVIERHLNQHGDVAFYTAVPATAAGVAEAARPAATYPTRAQPWLALLAALAALAGAAALRARRTALGGRADATATAASHLRREVAPPEIVGSAPSDGGLPATARMRWPRIAMAVIVALAAWLRLAQIEQVPAGFYCDEAGNLYNAASILRTGRDETGTRLPLYVWSFDTSYKNPVFIYASMLPVALFGPTPFAARFTAAAFGLGAVVAVYFLGRALGGTLVGVLAALFLAVTPWHIHFSRIAFELIAFPTLFLIGACGLVRFLDGRRTLPWAAAALGLSLYAYVPAKMFVPAFTGIFALLFRRELWHRRREAIAGLTVLAAVAAPVIAFDITNRERSTQYAREMTLLTEDTTAVAKLNQLAANYRHFYSPSFLLRDGDPVTRHSVRHHGELLAVTAPLLLLGLVAIAANPSRRRLLIIVWLALYPLAGALIRREVPSASRGIIGVPAFALLAAVGADWIWRHSGLLGRRRLRTGVIRGVLAGALLILLGAQTIRYWRLYTETYPLYSARHFTGFQYGHREVVDYFLAHYDDYDRMILTTSLSNQPEMFLRLFAGLRWPPTDAAPPFERPAKIDRGTIHELHLYEPGKRLLFAVVPRDLLYLADYEVLEVIRAPDGSAAFLIVDVREAKDFVHVWMMAGPYPINETPHLPAYEPETPPQRAPGGRRWQRYQVRRAPVHLDLLYGNEVDDACAWAINFVHSESTQSVWVYAGFDDLGEVWINGEPIALEDRDNPFHSWEDTAVGRAELREGRNQIAVKTCDISGGWTFYFRLAGDDGLHAPGIDWEYGFEEAL